MKTLILTLTLMTVSLSSMAAKGSGSGGWDLEGDEAAVKIFQESVQVASNAKNGCNTSLVIHSIFMIFKDRPGSIQSSKIREGLNVAENKCLDETIESVSQMDSDEISEVVLAFAKAQKRQRD